MQGAWGKEGRIFRKNQRDINTNALQKIQSAGTTSTNARYNCNEYVLNLVNEHGFSRSVRPNQTTVNIIPANINYIRSTVPQLYLDDVDRRFEKRLVFSILLVYSFEKVRYIILKYGIMHIN